MKVLKNVNYFSEKLPSSMYKELVDLISRYNTVKKILAQQYSSINSLTTVYNAREEIRDVWTSNGLITKFGIPTRFVRNAIDDAMSNIKSAWTTTKKAIKADVKSNKSLTKEDKHYIRYVLTNNELLQNILIHKLVEIPVKFEQVDIKHIKKLNILIRKYVREHLPRKSRYKKDSSILIDNEMFNIKHDMFYLTGYNKGKRYPIKLKSIAFLNGSIRLKLVDRCLKISNCIEMDSKENDNTNILGVDKNYINMIDTSESTSYGKDLNVLQNNYTDTLNEINKKRQFYHELIKQTKDLKKIGRIKKFNLGKKKYNNRKNRLQEEFRKHINVGIKQFIAVEKPKEVAVEKLNFTSKSKRNTNKKAKNKLSGWVKGIIQNRLNYHFALNDIKNTAVNAAYTSQTCNICGHFGVRKEDMFHCPCGKVEYSGFVAAQNVKQRLYDSDITADMKPSVVRTIIEKRLSDKNQHSDDDFNRANLDQLSL